MKKIVVCFVIAILILIVGVFADTKDVREEIKDFIEEKGIVVEDRDIMQVNFSDLSDEVKVNIEKIGNTSIVIFKVNSSKPFFVVTSSSESFQAEPLVNVCDTKLLLYFGINEVNGESDFLNMAS